VIVDYLVVGGGGGGGSNSEGGGGGAGGLVYAKDVQLPAGTYTWTVGAGGAVATAGSSSSLSSSTFGNVTAVGGGQGGNYQGNGFAGGSGGGGGGNPATSVSGGTSAIGQGYPGGSNPASTNYAGGGGGGAGSVGAVPNGNVGGAGGNGIAIPIVGSNVYYAGGGGGGNYNAISSTTLGGLGGGGAGANVATGAVAGLANTGGGGGGSGNNSAAAAAGGSGVIILRVYTNTGSRLLIGDGSGYSMALSAQSNAVTTDVMTVTDRGNVSIGLSNAYFNNPIDAKFDSLGNLYVADFTNNRIRKIAPNGIVTTLVGNGFPNNGTGTGTGSYIFSTYSLAVYDVGGVGYLFAGGNTLIYQITLPGGVVTWLAGNGTTGSNDASTGSTSTFNQPRGLYTDGTFVYVADFLNSNTIRRVTISTGQTQTLSTGGWATNPGTKPSLGNVISLVTDGTTIYYTTNYTSVWKIAAAGAAAGTAVSTAAYTSAYGIQYGNSAKTLLYVTDQTANKVSSLPTSGTSSTVPTIIAGSGTTGTVDATGTAASFAQLQNFAVDSTFSNLYLSDYNTHKIRKLNIATSNVTTYAGTGVGGFADGSVPTTTLVNNTLLVSSNVGINCNAPAYTLDVGGAYGTIHTTGGMYYGDASNSANPIWYTQNYNRVLQIGYSNGSALLNCTSNGLGIATGSPAYTLDVAGSIGTSTGYYIGNVPQTYTYGFLDTASTAQFVFLGTWNTQSSGRRLRIVVTSTNGYNGNIAQPQETTLLINTNNGAGSGVYLTAPYTTAFLGSAMASTAGVLGMGTSAPRYFRIVQNSGSQYQVYGYFTTYTGGSSTGGSFYQVTVAFGDTWVNSGTLYGVTGPSTNYLDVIPNLGKGIPPYGIPYTTAGQYTSNLAVAYGYGTTSYYNNTDLTNLTIATYGVALAASAWYSTLFSTQGYTKNVYVSARFMNASSDTMFGLATNPSNNANLASAAYSNLNYAWYGSVTLSIYESGVPIGSYGAFTSNDLFTITYDGFNVRYFLNNSNVRTIAYAFNSNAPLYFTTALYMTTTAGGGLGSAPTGPGITNVNYGPICETAQLTNANRIVISNVTATSVTPNAYTTYYNITNTSFATITLPTSQNWEGGSFWVFRNNTTSYLPVTVTYTGDGGGGTGSITIPPANSTTIVWNGVAGSTSTSLGGSSYYTIF